MNVFNYKTLFNCSKYVNNDNYQKFKHFVTIKKGDYYRKSHIKSFDKEAALS